MALDGFFGGHCQVWRLDTEILRFWYSLGKDLLPRLCVELIIALVLLRFPWFRRAIQQAETNWLAGGLLVTVFGGFSILGTHSGNIIDQTNWQAAPHSLLEVKHLTGLQIIVGFRDTWAMVAGLTGGFWVGLGAGLMAAVDRAAFGGGWGASSAVATVLLGVFAGAAKHFYPCLTNNGKGVLLVTVLGTLLQRVILLFSQEDICRALELAVRIGIPVALFNIAGCVLFVWMMQDLDRERLENDAREAGLLVLQAQVESERQAQLVQQAELRALRAQIDPHFLNNTLNDLKTLIRLAPDNARLYVSELAEFFKNTLKFSGQNTVSLQQELGQVQRYLTLQRLGYEDRLQAQVTIPPHLLEVQVLPFCLITLVENALKYAFAGRPPPYHVHIGVDETESGILLAVRDNGCGMSADRAYGLGKGPVQPDSKGSGVALYQLAQSLTLEFGESASLRVESGFGAGTTVLLTLPKRGAQ